MPNPTQASLEENDNTKENGLKIRSEERKRILEVQECARTLGLDDSVVRKILDEELSLESTKSRLLDKYTKTGSQFQQRGGIKAGSLDESDTRRLGTEEYLLHRAFPERFKLR